MAYEAVRLAKQAQRDTDILPTAGIGCLCRVAEALWIDERLAHDYQFHFIHDDVPGR